MDKDENKSLTEHQENDEDYLRAPMFEEFEDGNEFPPSINDLFGVMT